MSKIIICCTLVKVFVCNTSFADVQNLDDGIFVAFHGFSKVGTAETSGSLLNLGGSNKLEKVECRGERG